MLCLLAGAANSLAAQEVSVTNLQVASNNEITFNVSWGNRAGVWSDTVWVFVDYFNMDKQQMWRLPVANVQSSAGAAYLAPSNNAGFYIKGNARSAGNFSTAVTLTPVAGVVTTGSIRPCVYVTDYPPTGEYNLSGSSVTATLTGTAPYSVQYNDGSSATLTSSSVSITNGNGISTLVDATGNEGTIDCGAALPTVTGSTGTPRCGAGTVTIYATPSTGAVIDWYATATGGASLTTSNAYTTPNIGGSTTYYAQARHTTTGCVSTSRMPVVATVNATPPTPGLTQNGPKKSGTGVTFTASGGTNYQWTGVFNGQTGNPKTSSTATGSYTTSVRSYVTANGIACYSGYTGNVTGVVENAAPTIPGIAWTKTQVLPSQYTWANAPSACPSGMPTQAEFQKMVDAGYTWRAANSGYGNTENGTFFGSNSGACTVANGNCLFLPARGHNGNYVGTLGYYWSSAQNPSNTINAYRLYFNNGNSSVRTSSKTNGFSVVCVQ